jgi:hypothetical protein
MQLQNPEQIDRPFLVGLDGRQIAWCGKQVDRA